MKIYDHRKGETVPPFAYNHSYIAVLYELDKNTPESQIEIYKREAERKKCHSFIIYNFRVVGYKALI